MAGEPEADNQVGMTAPVPCRTCGAPVLWVKTEKGARMPLDPEPVEGGRVIIAMGPQMGQETAHTETRGETGVRLKCKEPAARTAYMPHHATCPQGREWQRGRK